ncbi:hypothetical protein [Photobacterium leiognathi]|uniref:hypothetical protein n=1 Tax=Photobacterium leiognathi TaxID=553611 RepID=UPI003DA0B5DA
MFSVFNKLKEKFSSDDNINESSIEVKNRKTEDEIIKDKISNFCNALESIAWNLHDDSSFFQNGGGLGKYEKYSKKLNAAREAYCKGYYVEPILMVDTTTFGKGDCGMIFTNDGIYIGEFDDCSYFIYYKDIIGRKFSTSGGKFLINHREYDFCASSQMKKLSPVITLLNSHLS